MTERIFHYEEPVEPEIWTEPNFHTDHAFSIAFVGDPQYISTGDYFLGTKKMEQLFASLADTAKERKVAQVIILGDLTDMGYRNDGNLAWMHYDVPITEEWENAKRSVFQLNAAGVPYMLCRGNHDDYMIDDYFNVPEYTDQFKGIGGFFSDSDARHPGCREVNNPERYIYWSAIKGHYEKSIVNSYKTLELCGIKYLLVTVDFNPTKNVIEWLDRILGEYPDHRAIVATHSFINKKGAIRTSEKGDTMFPLGYTADRIWELVLKKHKNLLMVTCGHVDSLDPIHVTQKGDHGNTVHFFLINPQGYDTKEDADGSILKGVQDTGMVLYMNFSEDGAKITFDNHATLLNKNLAATQNKEILLFEKETP